MKASARASLDERGPELTAFVQTLHAAIAERAPAASPVDRVAKRIFGALRTPRSIATPSPSRRPACALLEPVLADLIALEGSGDPSKPLTSCALDHARAVAVLAARLAWWSRAGSERAGEPFATGHANTTVIGKGGLEEREDVWIGMSLMAPRIDYPEHRHAPEEIYLALSPGHWRQDGGPWHEPGLGGIVHNPPHASHAMRSGTVPLLATWCLWIGD